MGTDKASDLAAHVRDLCRRHDIQILDRRAGGGWARKRDRTICIRPIKTQRTYIIALHEIGHIVGRNRSGRRLEQEAAAWDFVIEHAVVPLSGASYRFMLKALQSYLTRAAWSRRAMVIPEREHRFWQTYELLAARAAG